MTGMVSMLTKAEKVEKMDLEEARKVIEETDKEMAELFERRMDAVRDVAGYKTERGLQVEDKDRETALIKELSDLIKDEELKPFYVQFLQNNIDVSKRWQHRLMDGVRVAYCGVEGAFSGIAAKRFFPDGTTVPYNSFEAAYESVVDGTCNTAVLPIENSNAGEIGQVIDLMFLGDLYVNGVYELFISQNLLGIPGANKEDITKVISHPQALTQCRNYIKDHDLEIKTSENTALAAKEVMELNDIHTAAIASQEAADLYGLQVLDHDINESRMNTTRFAVFSKAENRNTDKKKGSAFILLFTVKDEVGGLAKAVSVISAFDFNMRVLRSRPMKGLLWHYYFYAELEGDDRSDRGRQMLRTLKGVCHTVKVAGRYSTADDIKDPEL